LAAKAALLPSATIFTAKEIVTLEAAYSLQMENMVGSIVPGKLANFTILDDNPVTCDAAKIKDIAVISTFREGQIFPVKRSAKQTAGIKLPENFKPVANTPVSTEHIHAHSGNSCLCSTGKAFAALLYPTTSN
jgi:adenine deaminase